MFLIALACTFLLTSCKNYIAYDESFDFVVEEGCSDHYYHQLSDGQQKMYRMIYKEAQDIFNGENKRNLGVYKYSDYGITKQDALTVWYAFFSTLLNFSLCQIYISTAIKEYRWR